MKASLMAQVVKNPPAMQETRVQSLGQEDPLEEDMETHSSVLAWKTPWTEKPGGLQSMGSGQTWLSDWAPAAVRSQPFVMLSEEDMGPRNWGPASLQRESLPKGRDPHMDSFLIVN